MNRTIRSTIVAIRKVIQVFEIGSACGIVEMVHRQAFQEAVVLSQQFNNAREPGPDSFALETLVVFNFNQLLTAAGERHLKVRGVTNFGRYKRQCVRMNLIAEHVGPSFQFQAERRFEQ